MRAHTTGGSLGAVGQAHTLPLERIAPGQLAMARIDEAELARWFGDKKVEVLNDGRTVPTPSPNTDFFPRDEYYLNRRP